MMNFLKSFQYQIYTIIWGISFILLGVFMWHDAFAIVLGSAFLTVGLGVILFSVDYQKKER